MRPTGKSDCIRDALLKGKKIKGGGREDDNIPQICKGLLLREQEKVVLPGGKQEK